MWLVLAAALRQAAYPHITYTDYLPIPTRSLP